MLFVDSPSHGDDLGEVFSGVIGVAAFLSKEAMNGTDCQVKLLGPAHAKVVHVEGLEEAELGGGSWVLERISKALEGNRFRHLSVLDNTLASVSTKVGCIQSKTEAVCPCVVDLNGSSIIELSHALDFDELDVVAVLIRVSFVFMDHNLGVRTLFNAADNKLLSLLTILVCNHELRAVVEECIRSESESLSQNETHPVCSADFIDCH